MTTVNIYLNFDGNCEAAFNFYRSIFGGEFSYFSRFGEFQSEGTIMSEGEANRVMHVGLPISKETILMGSDIHENTSENFKVGNNFTISVTTNSKEQADAYFASLSKNGTVLQAMELMFWGDYFGMCTDAFGINWMVSFNENGSVV